MRLFPDNGIFPYPLDALPCPTPDRQVRPGHSPHLALHQTPNWAPFFRRESMGRNGDVCVACNTSVRRRVSVRAPFFCARCLPCQSPAAKHTFGIAARSPLFPFSLFLHTCCVVLHQQAECQTLNPDTRTQILPLSASTSAQMLRCMCECRLLPILCAPWILRCVRMVNKFCTSF